MHFAELEKKIRAFLAAELGLDTADVGRDSELVSSGLVDSAGLVRLAALIEAEAGVVIPDRDIHARNFDTLAQIEAYLEAKTSG
jgi:acyl carrier protein